MAYFRNVALSIEDFDSQEDYSRALLEQERIRKILTNVDITDAHVAKQLYEGFNQHPEMFRSIVGLEFMDDGVTVTEATCTDNGIIRYTCKSCDKTKEEVIKAKGHEYSWVVAKPATTSEEGLEEYKCLVCGDVKETRKLEKLQAEGDKKTDNNNVSDKNITDKDVADKDIANKNITDKISSDNKASADNKQIDRSTKDDVISSVNNQ